MQQHPNLNPPPPPYFKWHILGYDLQPQGSLVDNQENLDPPEMKKDKN